MPEFASDMQFDKKPGSFLFTIILYLRLIQKDIKPTYSRMTAMKVKYNLLILTGTKC